MLHHKHYPYLHPNDIAYNAKISMVKNSVETLKKFIPNASVSSDNGLRTPQSLSHKKYSQRVIIHPSSNTPSKNWPKKRYYKLADQLKRLSFEPVLCLASHELEQYKDSPYPLKTFQALHQLASFIYESGYVIGNDSGLVHLASNLKIPSITLAGSPRIMRLWKADWLPTHLLCGPKYLINPKGLRLRDRYWGYFISTQRVIKNI